MYSIRASADRCGVLLTTAQLVWVAFLMANGSSENDPTE